MKALKSLSLALLLFSAAAFAAELLRFDSGFYYPGNIKTSPYYGFNKNVPAVGCHLAKDYKLAEGSPIYAVGSGVVEDANLKIPFYGSDAGAAGGALIIKHETSKGKFFYGLYGHINNFSVKKGDKVIGGQKIAEVGPYKQAGRALPHLHFGVNEASARYEGYTPTTNCVNRLGFVDPEFYLNKNKPKITAAESCKAVDDKVTTDENTIVTTANVLANDTDTDNDTLAVSAADSISANGATVTNNNDGTFTYTPKIDFSGTDSFNYTLTDNNGCTDQGKVTVTVKSDNQGSGDDSGGGSLSLNTLLALGVFMLITLVRRRVKHKIVKN